jgi:hypothetical protein
MKPAARLFDPGASKRAIRPATKPMMITQRICMARLPLDSVGTKAVATLRARTGSGEHSLAVAQVCQVQVHWMARHKRLYFCDYILHRVRV